jgi:triacylglycerol lipase
MPQTQPPVETMKPSWWWFQAQNKEAVDEMLDEEDRGDSVEDEQAKIRKKCKRIP